MAEANTLSTLQGLFKETYSDGKKPSCRHKKVRFKKLKDKLSKKEK